MWLQHLTSHGQVLQRLITLDREGATEHVQHFIISRTKVKVCKNKELDPDDEVVTVVTHK
jgi:hypothetical protein